ncbi:MAG: hypothetical protein JXA42_10070 [Anaerolineales bacterium]|nr:hypothetical protein [Anaerolineales bacterium]
MAQTHFIELARLEETGMINLCRHGIVHFTWHNVTIRIRIDAFRRLERLLQRGRAMTTAIPIYDEELSVNVEETEYRIAIGIIEILLRPEEFLSLVNLISNAIKRLEEVVATGDWNQLEPKPLSLAALETIFPPKFSPN